jgi:hypothetical protein
MKVLEFFQSIGLDCRSKKRANVAVSLTLLAGAASFLCSFCGLG